MAVDKFSKNNFFNSTWRLHLFNKDINPWETDSLNSYLACHCLKEDDKKEKKNPVCY